MNLNKSLIDYIIYKLKNNYKHYTEKSISEKVNHDIIKLSI
jgi:hypothetical protein